MTPEDLIAFETDIAAEFNAGHIKAPMHLAGGNEQDLIDLFKQVKPTDYVLGTWRAHFHALLKGVPPEKVKAAILEGRSIALCFPEHRILCSALVGGIAPIAVGLAWGIKHIGGKETVWCFLGDMAAETGIVHEAMKYATGCKLPIKWIVEDNGQGSGADTRKTWHKKESTPSYTLVHRYSYVLPHPHVGIGRDVPL